MTRILLIAHKFPPYSGVGARRWQKFIGLLQNKPVEITVITQNWHSEKHSSEFNNNVKIIRITDPFYLLKRQFKFLSTPLNKLEFLYRKLFNYTDEGYSFNKKAFKIAAGIIKNEKIQVLIATSPPYSSNYFAGLLKQKFPELKVIQDMRDAWIDGYFSWNEGDKDSHHTYKTEVNMEKLALNNCDAVVAVTPGLLQRLKAKISDPNIRTELITNGYDERDRKTDLKLAYPTELDKTKLNLCHFGTLDFGREDEFITFFKSVQNNKELSNKINIVLVGNNNPKIKQYILSNGINSVKLLPTQDKERLNALMLHSEIHLLVNDKEFYYAYGSKIFDAFLFKKPVVLVSKTDALTNIIIDRKLGLTTDNTAEQNTKITEDLINMCRDKNSIANMFSYDKVDLKEFEMAYLSEKYFQLINDLTK